MLTEKRTLDVSPPAADGGYFIDWLGVFTAGDADVLLDRTYLIGSMPYFSPAVLYRQPYTLPVRKSSRIKISGNLWGVLDNVRNGNETEPRRASVVGFSWPIKGKDSVN